VLSLLQDMSIKLIQNHIHKSFASTEVVANEFGKGMFNDRNVSEINKTVDV